MGDFDAKVGMIRQAIINRWCEHDTVMKIMKSESEFYEEKQYRYIFDECVTHPEDIL